MKEECQKIGIMKVTKDMQMHIQQE